MEARDLRQNIHAANLNRRLTHNLSHSLNIALDVLFLRHDQKGIMHGTTDVYALLGSVYGGYLHHVRAIALHREIHHRPVLSSVFTCSDDLPPTETRVHVLMFDSTGNNRFYPLPKHVV